MCFYAARGIFLLARVAFLSPWAWADVGSVKVLGRGNRGSEGAKNVRVFGLPRRYCERIGSKLLVDRRRCGQFLGDLAVHCSDCCSCRLIGETSFKRHGSEAAFCL